MKFKIMFILIVVIFLIACGGTDKLEISGTSSKVGGENKMKTAKFETNIGYFTIELFEDKMPITTKNFIDLVEKDFYEGTKFHRVIQGFMIQGGDPLSKDDSKKHLWGTGGPGYKIKDEFHSELSNIKGTLAMANAGSNTGGSQFFINTASNTNLDSKHPVFGKVVEGMNIVEKISKVPTDQSDKPIEDVLIEKITIE